MISVIVVGAAVWALFYVASRHAVAGNSDGATVILEGQSMQSGNLGLAGWSLSWDSFWSIDAIFYAFAVAISSACMRFSCS